MGISQMIDSKGHVLGCSGRAKAERTSHKKKSGSAAAALQMEL
jgi:hypothetical protein